MFIHETVLKKEAVEGLNIKPDGIYVDCTMGGAGHSMAIASRLSSAGQLIALDQDEQAIAEGQERLQGFEARIDIVRSNFRRLKIVLEELQIPKKNNFPQVDGILFDLGVSSPQLDKAERGFSYQMDAPLDMRMDQSAQISAYEVVNEWEGEDLAKLLRVYGEERFASRIARNIVQAREQKPIERTGELAEIIKEAIPAATRRTGPHPAKRSFQAIRIAVNDELGVFKQALEDSIQCLKQGGRISVITFHSLEDRICKQAFTQGSSGCICPPDFPMCVCGRKPLLKRISRKPILPSEEELERNPRARSAKLRIAEKA